MPTAAVEKAISLAQAKDATTDLSISFEGKTLERGQYIPRAEGQKAPQLAFAGTGPYLGIGIDLDAPFGSLPVLGPILHLMQPGLRATGGSTLTSNEPAIAPWVAPAPPPLSGPHRYLLLIYEQPTDFDSKTFLPANGKPFPITSRMRWDLGKFEREAKLGPILAATYFTSN